MYKYESVTRKIVILPGLEPRWERLHWAHTVTDPAPPAYLASTLLPQRSSEDLSTFQKLCSNRALASLEFNEDGYPRTECEIISGMI